MKKMFRRILTFVLAAAMIIGSFEIAPAQNASAYAGGYRMFLAIGAGNDWGYGYAGGEVTGDMKVTDAYIAEGQTATVSVEMAGEVDYTWYVAPTILAEGVTEAEFDVKVFADGKEITTDLSAGDNWWYEGTGDYTADQAIRIAGGYNEWGTKYIAESPKGYKKLEFQVTCNKLSADAPTPEYRTFLAIGAKNDWSGSYAGGTVPAGMSVVDGKLSEGGTTTVSVTFDEAADYTWYVAPTIVAPGLKEAEFEVKAYLDGVEIATDLTAGDNWWFEGTGDYSATETVRIAGGYNEWGTKYIAESPKGYKTIEFKITAKKLVVEKSYEMFLAIGANNDWSGCYDGAAPAAGMKVVDARIAEGWTARVAVEYENPVDYTWYVAPAIIVPGVTEAEFEVTALIDGEEVATDLTAGDNWWYEGTGRFDAETTIRVGGGYNEWGTKYIAESPKNYKRIEYVVTAKTLKTKYDNPEYDIFVAFGGDITSGDWGYGYAGGEVTGDITPTNGKISEGSTVTVGLEFATPVAYTWYTAPTIVAPGIKNAEFDVKVLIDGVEVASDLTVGDNWWYEGTGDYDASTSIRVAGGYNEWGAKYLAESPKGFTKLEFVVTAKKLSDGSGAAGATAAVKDARIFLAMGGDVVSGDWGYGYAGGELTGNITNVTEATISEGDTVTVGLEFAEPVAYTWWLAPVIVAPGLKSADFTVEAYFDGVKADIDLTAGDNWWGEDTGDYAKTDSFRIAGGYNEWGTKYLAESPVGYKKVEYVITANKLSAALSYDNTAYLVFASGDWSVSNWDSAVANTIVNGDGSYSVTFNPTAPVAGAVVFCVDVVELGTVADVSAISVSDVSILVDGKELPLDASKLVYGDLEENGNFRIEIYNEYGATKDNAGIDAAALAAAESITVNFTLSGIVYQAPEEETVAKSQYTTDLDGQYNAYIAFQTPTYSFRNVFDDASYGRGILAPDGTEYFYQVTGWDAGNNAIKRDGYYEDAVIAGNGTYTVAAKGLDLTGDFDSQSFFNLIALSTDIPNDGQITVSDFVLKIDGRSIELSESGAVLNGESVDYMQYQLQSVYNKALKEIGAYNVPPTEMTITFTVSGFNYDKAAETAPAETTATTDTTSTDTTASTETAKSEDTVKTDETAKVTEAPASTDTTGTATTAPADTASASEPAEGGSNTALIVVIIVVVVLAAAAALYFFVFRKKIKK